MIDAPDKPETETDPEDSGTDTDLSILLGIDVRELRARMELIDGEYVLLIGDAGSAIAIEQSAMMTDPRGAIDSLASVARVLAEFRDVLERKLSAPKQHSATVLQFPRPGRR